MGSRNPGRNPGVKLRRRLPCRKTDPNRSLTRSSNVQPRQLRLRKYGPNRRGRLRKLARNLKDVRRPKPVRHPKAVPKKNVMTANFRSFGTFGSLH